MASHRKLRLPLPRTLPAQVAFVLILAGAIVVGAVAVIESRLHGERMQIEAVTRHGILAHHSIRAMLVAMGDKPPETIDDVLEGLAAAPGVRHIRVLDQHGNIRHSSQRGEVGHQAADFPAGAVTEGNLFVAYDEEGDRSYARIYEPAVNTGRCQRCHGSAPTNGIMELKFDTTSTRKSLTRDRHTVLAILVASQVVLVMLVFFLFRAILVKPVRTLVDSMRRVAAGELDQAVDIETPSEFAELGFQFNDMMAKLRTAQEERDRYYGESMARAAQMITVGEPPTATAHEIRNPLTGISGALQILSRDPALEARKPIIKEILNTVDRLAKTINDLLAYGRPSKPAFERCDLNRVALAAIRLLRRPAVTSHDIEIVEDLAPSLPGVDCDPGQVQQVLLNILLNAMQAMEDGGTLTLRSHVVEDGSVGPCVRVEVQDDGPGVAPDELARIFAPFYTTKPKGTGLGLAISQRIIEENRGRIQALAAEGGGLVVQVELPVAAGDPGTNADA